MEANLPKYHTVRTDVAGRDLPHNRRLRAENAETDRNLMRQASARHMDRAAASLEGPPAPPGGWPSTLDYLRARRDWVAAKKA